MSWKDIIKAKGFNFEDISFIEGENGYISSTKLIGDIKLSVSMGKHNFSKPKEKLDNPHDYEQYEIAFFDEKGWATEKLTGVSGGPIEYVTKKQIEDYVKDIMEERLQ